VEDLLNATRRPMVQLISVWCNMVHHVAKGNR
jgi:hypothetical protein